MAVQLTTNNSYHVATQGTSATTAPHKTPSLHNAAGTRVADSVKMHVNPQASHINETHAALTAAQRAQGVLNVAGHALSESSRQLDGVHSLVAAGKSDPSARLALADALSHLDTSLNSAVFEGQNVLSGADFSVAPGSYGAGATVSVGSADLKDLASLLATGGRGFAALKLDDVAGSSQSLQRAEEIISGAKSQVDSQTMALGGLIENLSKGLDGLAKVAPVADIAANASQALAAQANISVESARHLLS